MSERLARIALGVVSGLALLAALAIDLPRASDGRFWSDGATYYAMAGSLAFDGDLRFEAEDLARVRASYPGGPQGVFLKRVRDGSGEPRLVYAKALVYPAAAAPLVRLLGMDRGLLVLNALAFVAALWLGFVELRRASGAGRAAAGVLAVVAGGVVPVYLLWQTPEIFNLALVTAGLVAWRRGFPLASAVLLGVAAYSKPTNLALALPLLLEPLVVGGASWARRVVEATRRGARGRGGGGRRLLSDLAGHGRAQLPGGRAQDVLRPVPLRSRRHLRLGRASGWRPTTWARSSPGATRTSRPRAWRRSGPPPSCGGPSG